MFLVSCRLVLPRVCVCVCARLLTGLKRFNDAHHERYSHTFRYMTKFHVQVIKCPHKYNDLTKHTSKEMKYRCYYLEYNNDIHWIKLTTICNINHTKRHIIQQQVFRIFHKQHFQKRIYKHYNNITKKKPQTINPIHSQH